MQCVLYARVSTDKQAEKELSIPAQLQAMRDYARNHNWDIAEEFIEAGVSARTTDRRELRRLIARCQDRASRIDCVLVHKLDRLARNVADHVAIRAILHKLNVKLVSVSENVDDSVSGRLVEHIMAAIAEFDSANLSEEVRKGMKQKVAKGGWPHKPALGYRIVRGADGQSRIEIDPVAGPALRNAFERYASGDCSARDISNLLASLGVVC
jgi:DNA invertase Pin-like site-specific DNA recombinase